MDLNTEVFDFDIEGAERLYLLEKHRRRSFKIWPFADDAPCSIIKVRLFLNCILFFKSF